MSTYNLMPVYGPGHELLQCVPVNAAMRLIDEGLAVPVGTKKRFRALRATPGNVDLLRSSTMQTGHTYFSHDGETNENPRGVWTFRKLGRHERDDNQQAA